jgi:hypothetical protein
MHRSWLISLILILAGLVACSSDETNEPPSSNEAGFDSGMLGRWDVTVHGEDTYPLWFELTRDGDVLSGRLQPRGGHALPLDRVEANANALSMEIDGTSYEGSYDGSAWSGTGAKGETSFEWSALRAPELAPPDNPTWGEPVELLNGVDLTGWVPLPGGENRWRVEDGVLVNEASGANLRTEDTFWDFKLHIEVNVPEHSNSGIYLRGRHEVQVVDPAVEGLPSQKMGSIYGQLVPSMDATHPAGEWQSFDITLLGRWVTVVLNGETIIDHQEIPGITGGALDSNEGEPGPFYLQGDHGRVLYRNIVLTPAS